MRLSLGFDSPSDLLGKVERDLTRLETAVAEQDKQRVADALYDFSVSITSMRDWLLAHSSTSFTPADVKDLASKSVALNSFRDIANSDKHREITKYIPTTDEATLSAPAMVMSAIRPGVSRFITVPRFRAKIIRADGARLEAVELARGAVQEWRDFMTKHGI